MKTCFDQCIKYAMTDEKITYAHNFLYKVLLLELLCENSLLPDDLVCIFKRLIEYAVSIHGIPVVLLFLFLLHFHFFFFFLLLSLRCSDVLDRLSNSLDN